MRMRMAGSFVSPEMRMLRTLQWSPATGGPLILDAAMEIAAEDAKHAEDAEENGYAFRAVGSVWFIHDMSLYRLPIFRVPRIYRFSRCPVSISWLILPLTMEIIDSVSELASLLLK